jgi:rod shape-determining protein MreD
MKKKHRLIIPIALYGVLFLIAYIFQSMIFPYLRIVGLVPLILPIISTGIAVYQGSTAGGISGLFAGVFCDLSFNQPLGTFTVILTLTGIAIGALTDTIMARRFGTYLISCAVVLSFCAFVQMVPLLFLHGVPIASLFNTALWQTIYSMIFTVPLWFCIKALRQKIEDAMV